MKSARFPQPSAQKPASEK